MEASGGDVRVGLLTAHLTRAGGGVFTSVRQLATALVKNRGMQVEVFGPLQTGANLTEWSPLKVHMSQITGPGTFSYAPGLSAELTGANLDLVHLHGLWMYPSIAAAGFTQATERPHLVSPHGMLDPWALRNSGWKKRLAGMLFENANIRGAMCLHALNAAEEVAIRDYGYRGAVCVIPNGVDLPGADEPAATTPDWAANDPAKKTMLYLGRIHQKKNLPNLLIGWSRLSADERAMTRLVIAGWDERGQEAELKEQARALGIDVVFPGPLFGEAKRAALNIADAMILPSLSEGLPMAVLEAWAGRVPVLMTPECNLPEGFSAEAAIRIETSPEAIAVGISKFLALSETGKTRMVSNGVALVSSRFAWPVVASAFADLYRWLAGKGPRPETVKMP